jgi:circadian clock protein KaiC
LTIIKSRGTAHSNQVRELVLNSKGITLADVYFADGEVLMGTARWQKEAAEKSAEELLHKNFEHRRRELELAQAEVNARIGALQREMDLKRTELEMLLSTEAGRIKQFDMTRDALWNMRSGDEN